MLDVWATVTALTDDTGRAVAIAKVDRDFTEIKRARTELEREVQRRTALLRESEARLRAVLNAPNDAIITITQAGIIDSVNPAAERMFDYTAVEMVGRKVELLVSDAFRVTHRDYPQKHHRTGGTRFVGSSREIEARRKDGSTFPVEWSVGEVESLGLYTGILRDISRRKELQREVVNIASLEQQRIGQDLHDECGQQLTALGLLVNGLIESLKDPEPAVVELAQKIARGLTEILHQIRGIAQGLAVADVKGADLARALRELTNRLCSTSKVRCSFEADQNAGVDNETEATQLYHIAQEACTNALKHAEPKAVAIRLLAKDNAVVLEIRDDGRGIGGEAGDGLGLRIMRNRAAVIGADFSIQQAQPTGTIVTCASERARDHGGE